jgi:hypothetical protein
LPIWNWRNHGLDKCIQTESISHIPIWISSQRYKRVNVTICESLSVSVFTHYQMPWACNYYQRHNTVLRNTMDHIGVFGFHV